MVCLSVTPEALVPTGDLAKATRVPAHYLAKVLQQLAAAQLINGRRGVGGGYRLARPPGEITLRQVVAAVMPLDRITSCPLGVPCEQLCELHRLMDAMAAEVLRTLDGRTLADLIPRPGQESPLCSAGVDGRAPAALTITRPGR